MFFFVLKSNWSPANLEFVIIFHLLLLKSKNLFWSTPGWDLAKCNLLHWVSWGASLWQWAGRGRREQVPPAFTICLIWAFGYLILSEWTMTLEWQAWPPQYNSAPEKLLKVTLSRGRFEICLNILKSRFGNQPYHAWNKLNVTIINVLFCKIWLSQQSQIFTKETHSGSNRLIGSSLDCLTSIVENLR